MTLGRAWALALLVLPAILLWLRFRAARPRTAEASSLLVWRKVSPSGEPAGRPRPPWTAWVEAAGALLVVLALADPAVQAAAPGAVRVLLDVSPSMHVVGSDGRTRLEAARETVSQYDTLIQESERPEEDLPALLAAGSPVVVVTDHRLPGLEDDPPRLRVIGVGERGFNAGIVAASGERGESGEWTLLVTLLAHGSPGPVEGVLRSGDRSTPVTLSPGSPRDLLLGVSTTGLDLRLSLTGDVLGADDEVRLAPIGGHPVICMPAGEAPWQGPLLRALEAAGAGIGGRVERWTGRPMVLLGRDVNQVEPEPLWLTVAEGEVGGDVTGTDVVAMEHALVREVAVDPASVLGARVAADLPGTPLLMDSTGPLASIEVNSRRVLIHLGFVPGGTWVERDPSFVVLAKNIVDRVSGGEARLEGAGVLDRRETAEAAGDPFGDLDAALEEAALPDPAARTPLAVMLLLAGGVLLAGAWLAAR